MSVGGECQTGRVPDGESVRVAIPDARCPMPDARCPILDARFPMPDSRCPIPDSRCQFSIACEYDRATKEPRKSRQSGQQWREYWRVPQICLGAE